MGEENSIQENIISTFPKHCFSPISPFFRICHIPKMCRTFPFKQKFLPDIFINNVIILKFQRGLFENLIFEYSAQFKRPYCRMFGTICIHISQTPPDLDLDGVDHWPALLAAGTEPRSGGTEPRSRMVYNLDDQLIPLVLNPEEKSRQEFQVNFYHFQKNLNIEIPKN